MNGFSKLRNLWTFYKKAVSYRNIDDDALAELVYKILEDKEHSCGLNNIESIRKTLLKNEKIIDIEDLGAGSKFSNSKRKPVRAIAKTSLSPKWQCELMSNLIQEYQCQNIIELGTSLGISASYLASANWHGIVYTLEGSESIASIAMNTFASLKLRNIKLIYGNFDITLPTLLKNIETIDFAFIDGNHRYDKTLLYFEQILAKSHEKTIFVFDDIHWSSGMEKAWKEITRHSKITATLDFFSFGIAFSDIRYAGNYKIVKNKYKFF